MATASQLPVRIEHTLYTCIEPNRLIEHDPVSVAINMNTKEEKKLPFDYPDYPGSEVKLKRYGMEASYSVAMTANASFTRSIMTRISMWLLLNTTRYGKSRLKVSTSTKYNCQTS